MKSQEVSLSTIKYVVVLRLLQLLLKVNYIYLSLLVIPNAEITNSVQPCHFLEKSRYSYQ